MSKYSDREMRAWLYQARTGDAEALATLACLAQSGHINALYYLGLYWFRTPEPERAIACWQAAFPQGCRRSRYYYGKALYRGRGIPQNFLWALRQWQMLSGEPGQIGRLARHALYVSGSEKV